MFPQSVFCTNASFYDSFSSNLKNKQAPKCSSDTLKTTSVLLTKDTPGHWKLPAVMLLSAGLLTYQLLTAWATTRLPALAS